MAGGRELVRADPGLGRDGVCGGGVDAGDLIQPLRRPAASGAAICSIVVSGTAMPALSAPARASIRPAKNAWWRVK